MIAVHKACIGSWPTQNVSAAGERPADDHLPHRARFGAAQRIGLAAGKHRRHARPEELRAERRDERGDADLGDEHAVDEADEDAGGEARDDGDPAEIVFLEEHREDEAGERDDRREAEIDLAGADDEGQPDRKQDQRRQRGQEGRVDERRQEDLRRRVHEQAEQEQEDDDDRQASTRWKRDFLVGTAMEEAAFSPCAAGR